MLTRAHVGDILPYATVEWLGHMPSDTERYDDAGAQRDDVPSYVFDMLKSIGALQQAMQAIRK